MEKKSIVKWSLNPSIVKASLKFNLVYLCTESF
jgi:hypothetical protein